MKLSHKVSNVSNVSKVSGVLSKTKLVNIQSNHFINDLTHPTHLTHNTHLKRTGFTLAEVLITLGIIGVVAAITMPVLIQNYQKKVTVERLKTTYSILYQAIKLSEVENGTVDTWEIPVSSSSSDSEESYTLSKEFAEKYLLPYIKNVKTCDRNSDECWQNNYTMLNGDTLDSLNYTYGIILSNGVLLGITDNGGIEIYTDINGQQKPNKVGKDLFDFIITNKPLQNYALKISQAGLYIYGYGISRDDMKSTSFSQGCNKAKSGFFCGALIMYDGWKISDDYPW